MNDTSHTPHTQFESRLMASAPVPRADFERELAQRLQVEFAGRRPVRTVHPLRTRRSMLRAAIVLAVLLIGGIGAVIAINTALQQALSLDAGIKAILEQGLGHEIGLSQSHEGYSVTLEWAYADGSRLTLAYLIQGLPGGAYTNLTSDVYRLRDRETGDEIPFHQGMSALLDANGELSGWGQPDVMPIGERGLVIRTYDLSVVPTSGRSVLQLQLEVDAYGITLEQRTRLPIEQFNAMKQGPEAHFVFDFSIALGGQQRMFDAPQTATDQDITLMLRRVTVSPSQTRVVVCFPPPDPAREWTAIPRLTTDTGEVAGGGGGRRFMDGGQSCQDYTYFAGMFDYTGRWHLEITELIGFGSGGGADQQRIAGSWVFEFVVP